jgi:hypothetical protein
MRHPGARCLALALVALALTQAVSVSAAGRAGSAAGLVEARDEPTHQERKALAFLEEHMPFEDRSKVHKTFLLQQIRLALEAREVRRLCACPGVYGSEGPTRCHA